MKSVRRILLAACLVIALATRSVNEVAAQAPAEDNSRGGPGWRPGKGGRAEESGGAEAERWAQRCTSRRPWRAGNRGNKFGADKPGHGKRRRGEETLLQLQLLFLPRLQRRRSAAVRR